MSTLGSNVSSSVTSVRRRRDLRVPPPACMNQARTIRRMGAPRFRGIHAIVGGAKRNRVQT